MLQGIIRSVYTFYFTHNEQHSRRHGNNNGKRDTDNKNTQNFNKDFYIFRSHSSVAKAYFDDGSSKNKKIR